MEIERLQILLAELRKENQKLKEVISIAFGVAIEDLGQPAETGIEE